MSELRMQISETNYLLDGRPVSGAELLFDNEDFEEEDLAEIASIPPGSKPART